MAAVAHSPAFAKKVGVPQSVGQDFNTADKGKTFKRGGDMATQMDPKMMAMMAKKRAMAGAPSARPAPPMGGMGGGAGMAAMKKGGAVRHDMAKVGKDTKPPSSGLGAGHKKADGIAQRGKTKGDNITMKKGGKC